MKKLIAREFLWLVVALVAAAPLAFLVLSSLDLVARGDHFTEHEKVFIAELFLIAYIFSFLGIYIVRFVVMAIKVLSVKEEPPAK